MFQIVSVTLRNDNIRPMSLMLFSSAQIIETVAAVCDIIDGSIHFLPKFAASGESLVKCTAITEFFH